MVTRYLPRVTSSSFESAGNSSGIFDSLSGGLQYMSVTLATINNAFEILVFILFVCFGSVLRNANPVQPTLKGGFYTRKHLSDKSVTTKRFSHDL